MTGCSPASYETETVRLSADMVTMLVRVVAVLLSVPLHTPTLLPAAGWAVRWITVPMVYWPLGQPVEFPGKAVGVVPEPVEVRVRE
jgi:hypothetical protein